MMNADVFMPTSNQHIDSGVKTPLITWESYTSIRNEARRVYNETGAELHTFLHNVLGIFCGTC